MNDFTKEELLHIFDSVNTDAKYYGDDHIAHPILKKLESMIENYCEQGATSQVSDVDYVNIRRIKGCTMSIQQFIDKKFSEIAERLPSLVHSDPASFACGYNQGYKAALLDLEREFFDRGESVYIPQHPITDAEERN